MESDALHGMNRHGSSTNQAFSAGSVYERASSDWLAPPPRSGCPLREFLAIL
jgi:hypothetical protein